MNRVFSSSCESSREQLYAGEEDPCLRGSHAGLEVLGQASVAVEPSERALDDPAAGKELEALGPLGALDDLQRPASHLAERALELGPGIGAIGEDVAQPRELPGHGGEHRRRAVAVLDIGAVDHERDQQAARVGEVVSLSGDVFTELASW